MNIQNTSYGHYIIENKNRILFFVLLFVLSSMKMFGQTVTPTFLDTKEEVVIVMEQEETNVVSLESQIDFVGWFMGSKQSHNEETPSINSSNSAPTKKQILTSGITPNRVLYRTFMKRVTSKDNAIV